MSYPENDDLCKTCGGKFSDHNYSDSLDSRTDPLGHMYECWCKGGDIGHYVCTCLRFLPMTIELDTHHEWVAN